MPRLVGPVGWSVRSHVPDVKYVQMLLSDWLLVRDQAPLAVDGKCGPLTDGAIRQFQSAETGIVDGRVDPGGPSIKRLEIRHMENLASGIYGLAQFGDYSGIAPPPELDESDLWGRYLSALRSAFD
jgi:peptidoglycan hydrolase-like protein with peptidoglycan-binding domain